MRPIVNIKSRKFDITDKILGAGSFSLVKLALKKDDKKPIALKICHCNSEHEWLQSLNEICLLKKLVHDNIIKIENYEITRFHVLIGLDRGEATLKEFINRHSIEDMNNYVIFIMSQIMNGLNFIHSFRIIHGDIKPNNIIYNTSKMGPQIKIMDFGLSHVAGREDFIISDCDTGGTKIYLAPERLSRSFYDETSDLFSAGIIFFELLFKKHPFYKEGDNYVEIMKNKPDPKFPVNYQTLVPKEWLMIVCSMLSYNPKFRSETRNCALLKSHFHSNSRVDYQMEALQNISSGEEAEKICKYANAAVFYMEACINLGIACHEIDSGKKEFVKEVKERISQYKMKVINLIHLYKHSYSEFESIDSDNIHDEYYEYLMEVTASTPKLKHYLEIGYNGELYLRERKKKDAFKNFMDALQYLNCAMQSEPLGDRKTIIGKKMLQWTNIAESLKGNVNR